MAPGTTSPSFSWSTDMVPVDQRVAAWSTLASTYFGQLQVRYDGRAPFHASLRAVDLGPTVLLEISGSGHHVVRGTHVEGRPLAYVNVQLSGWSAVGGSRASFTTAAGRIGLMSASWPTIVDLPEDFHQLLISLPLDLLEARVLDIEAAYGQVLHDEARAALIINRATHLIRHGGDLDPGTARLVGGQLVDLIVHAYAQQGRLASPRPRQLLQQVLDEIDRRHAEPGLSASDVAGSLNISLRYLQQLLADHGTTFGRRLTSRRIDRCREDLDAGDGQPIAAIAHRHGFTDPTRFSKAFRAQYGVSPREWRAAGSRR